MKRIIGIIILITAFLTCTSEKNKVSKKELITPTEKFSYALGLDVGNSLKNLKKEIDLPSFMQAVDDILNDKEPMLTKQEAQTIKMEAFNQQSKEQIEKAKNNLEKGENFLAENKNKEGVITTATGLQYIVLKEGDGPKPKKTNTVKVHYKGTLIDGTEFDSSYKRGEPATFPVTGVISGWTEALQLMNVGSKYRLFIPSKLGYGSRGAGAQIGPNEVLIFEVELLEIVK